MHVLQTTARINALPWTRAVIALGVIFGATPFLHAEHARIDLRVIRQGNGEEVTSICDEEPPAGGSIEPPVITVKANEPLVLQFIFENIYPHRVVEGVRVRYYVTRVTELGRKPAPSSIRDRTDADDETHPYLDEGVVTRGEFKMDFKPDCRVGTRLRFQITQPGMYSARVESLDTDSDHEHFSAIDIVAE